MNNTPCIHRTVYAHPSAVILGDVRIGRNVFVGPGAVIRADEPGSSIVIENDVNVQDRVVIHALAGSSVMVGARASLSHACIVHGPCKIGKNCFVGFGAVVFRASLGSGVFIKSLSTVEGVKVSSDRIIPNNSAITTQVAASFLKKTTQEQKLFSRKVVRANLYLLRNYKNREG
jgi:carbonic anhydrase/acetyltransferase-like protein (isoleucine patch superfamily)